MNNGFYLRLAAVNLRKNGRTILPYLIACTATIAMFFTISSLSQNSGLEQMTGSETVSLVLGLGTTVTGIFSVIFLFYTNSFLLKRRKKELGLYNILGMEKRHLSRVILWETLLMALISLTVGLSAGLLLNKLMYLLLLSLFNCAVPLGFEFSLTALQGTLLFFLAIFALIYLNSLRQIHLSNPIELLKGGQTGEREPKTKALLAIFGTACLGGGYYIALTTTNPLSAFVLFFVAVVLVIIGTYCLFTAGSIAVLKLLRKNKRYYYQTRHFISLSGMLYRMKQNAVGLANICVLSTAVLVMISSTLSLFLGMEDGLRTLYPRSIQTFSADYADPQKDRLHTITEEVLSARGLSPENTLEYTYLTFAAVRQEDTFSLDNSNSLSLLGSIYSLNFVLLDDYNRLTGSDQSLESDELLLCSPLEELPEVLTFGQREFRVKGQGEEFLSDSSRNASVSGGLLLVVRDLPVLEDLYRTQQEVYGENASAIQLYYGFDLNTDKETLLSVYQQLSDEMKQAGLIAGRLDCREEQRNNFLSLYGGLFFIGVFLGVLFIMATILIIYYKQISEGYDDRDRFLILQKVGMEKQEIRRSIHSQVMTVFFLPLAAAGVHVLFAFPFITRILEVFSLTNVSLFALCTIGCFLVFALFYALVYSLTARTYYRIVSA